MAALADRLQRWRQWRGLSQATLARHAGVDPMIVSKLERGQKPQIVLETAARLARVCGWTLEELCGLVPEPAIPAPPVVYVPMQDGKPAWLLPTWATTSDQMRLVAQIVAWERRGATLKSIADSLQAWGIPYWYSLQIWTPALVQHACQEWLPKNAQERRTFLQTYAPPA
jgi:transcriptional regulator with XRE-family HTH domain